MPDVTLDLGALDLKVMFRRAAVVTDSLNEAVQDGWQVLAEVMASRVSVRDGERNDGRQVQREVSDRFRTHWGAALAALDLTEQLVVVEDGIETAYDLVGRKMLGRRQGFEWSANARPQMAAAGEGA